MRVMGFTDATGFGNFVSFGDPGAWTTGGNMRFTIPLEPGDRLARIDVYAVRATTPRYIELRRVQVHTATDSLIGSVMASAGDGLKVMTYQPFGGLTVGAGEVFYVLDNNSAATKPYIGAIVQYFPVVPQLRILPAPVRIYDSRPGPPTTGTAKGIFTNETRVVSAANNNSGVPVGARAVLVNFAVTTTNTGGYGTLWAAGIPDPGTASINWSPTAKSTLNNTVLTAVDGSTAFNVKIAGTADVVLDVVAYYI